LLNLKNNSLPEASKLGIFILSALRVVSCKLGGMKFRNCSSKKWSFATVLFFLLIFPLPGMAGGGNLILSQF